MPARFYMDHNVFRAITDGLRLRDVDVLTAAEDGTTKTADPQLLDRATALGRVLFTHDDDLIKEATRRLRSGQPFGGVIYVHQLKVSIGPCVADLALIAEVYTNEELRSQVMFLPL